MVPTTAWEAIEQEQNRLQDLCSKIWEHPEVALEERQASVWTAEYLKEVGFSVQKGIYGMETAIRATFGQGHPVIGFFGEYDALPNLSQEVGTVQKAAVPCGAGHGCCHNLLGVTAVASALGLKAELEKRKCSGTVVFYGCPAEETLMGKGMMAKQGAFRELDIAIANHPAFSNEVSYGSSQGTKGFELHFHGRSSHAAFAPEAGRSALDALELTNVAINYLREHVPDDVRMHYITLHGGTAVNSVPEEAAGLYNIRAYQQQDIDQVYQRILKIAEGAAMMTETAWEVKPVSGCYPVLNNRVLVEAIHACMQQVEFGAYSEEELDFGQRMNAINAGKSAEKAKQYCLKAEEPFATKVNVIGNYNIPGGFDIGDVSHIVPTVFFQSTSYPVGLVAHTWQVTACAGHVSSFKGCLYAAKVMDMLAVRLIEEPALVEAAQQAFHHHMGNHEYVCPIP